MEGLSNVHRNPGLSGLFSFFLTLSNFLSFFTPFPLPIPSSLLSPCLRFALQCVGFILWKILSSSKIDSILQCSQGYSMLLYPIIPERKDATQVLGMTLISQDWGSFPEQEDWFPVLHMRERGKMSYTDESNFSGLFALMKLINTGLFLYIRGPSFYFTFMLYAFYSRRGR